MFVAQMDKLNKERSNHLKDLSDANNTLSKITKSLNGDFMLGSFLCDILHDQNGYQIIERTSLSSEGAQDHFHTESNELLIVVEGKLKIIHEGKKKILEKGDHIEIKMGEVHSAKPITKEVKFLAVVIPHEKIYTK